jgi:hypothetical protein|tara:strand:+ start:96 stop:872 length:777 start_codon:yes stop_codon:yes gene_type:complete
MINIIDVYNAVRDLCNKDQRGFVTPEVFSTFAGIAQQNIFNEMFQELLVANRARKQGIDPARDKSLYKNVEEDLSYFITSRDLSDDIEDNYYEDEDGNMINPANEGASVFKKPSDLARIISINRTNSNTQVAIVYNPELKQRILGSYLSSPSGSYPVAFIEENNIVIHPNAVNSVTLRYYRQPASRQIGVGVDLSSTPVYVEMVAGADIIVPDPINSRHFELPGHYKNEVIMEIAKMIGIRLRDNYLSGFAIAEEKAE